MKRLIILLVLLCACAVAGCGRVNIQRDGDGGLNVTANVTEAEVTTAINEALAARVDPEFRDVQVDLQAGQIILNGIHDRADGSEISGTLTLSLSVTDGALDASITSVNIEGIDVQEAWVVELNERIEAGLARLASRQHENVQLVAVTITDSDMSIEFNLRRGE